MRFHATGVCALLIIGCSPAPPLQPRAAPPNLQKMAAPAVPVSEVISSPVVSGPPVSALKVTRQAVNGVSFEGVAFDSRNYRLVVVDQPAGPGTQFADAASAGQTKGALAAINAGFFTPEGTPLGMVVSGGRSAGGWNTASSLGSAVWFQDPSGNQRILRRETLGRSGALAQRELIQAGPLLIENSHSVGGLEATKTSVRSVILWDGGTRWWIGLSSPCTLAEVSDALSHSTPAGWPPKQAINLDGGRSSDFWVSSSVAGGPINRRSPWNRPVRNFLVLIRR